MSCSGQGKGERKVKESGDLANHHTYCLQHSLETNWPSPLFLHQPYYLPFSALDAGFTAPPFLLSALHYFEWHSTLHGYSLIIIQIHISPAFTFQNPIIHIATSPQYSCPAIHIFWWDLPTALPLITLNYLQEYNSISPNNINLFIRQLDNSTPTTLVPLLPMTKSLPLCALLALSLSLTPQQTLTLYL